MRRRSIVRWAPGLIAALVLGLIVTLAVRAIGYPVNKLDLNDSGIWVTNDAEQSYGRINKSAVGLDAFLDLPGAAGAQELDVLQEGGAAVEYDAAGRVKKQTDAAGVVTTYAYIADGTTPGSCDPNTPCEHCPPCAPGEPCDEPCPGFETSGPPGALLSQTVGGVASVRAS